MARKKKSTKLGFDPLAWMKGGPEPSPAEEKPAASDPEPAAPVEEKPAAPIARKAPAAQPDIPEETVVSCGDALGMEDVGSLKERLSAALQSGGNIVLDAADIHSAQTPGMQLFVTFVRATEDKGLQFEWRNPTQALKESARLLGLSDSLKLAA